MCNICKKKFLTTGGNTKSLRLHLTTAHYWDGKDGIDTDPTPGGDKNGPLSEPKKGTPRGKSYVWKYCSKVTREEAVCNICDLTIKTTEGNTKGLRYHLKNTHDWDGEEVEGSVNADLNFVQC